MRALRNITLSFGALCVVSVAGCGGTDEQPEMPDPTVVDRSAEDLGLPEAEAGSEQPQAVAGGETEGDAPPSGPVRVVAGERTPVEGGNPQVRILAPRNGQRLASGPVSLRLQVRNWELQPEPGQHVHVIVDNEPYIAVRDVRQPLNLSELVQRELGHELAEGTHVVRVFPSRAHHESIKTQGAFATVMFHYVSPTPNFTFDARAPLLTYSRPKGCNPVGERILLDFFVSNVELAADGARVHYEIGRARGDITSWVPHYIEGLRAGAHSVHLTLVGADGTPIAGPFNDTTREIRVAQSCD